LQKVLQRALGEQQQLPDEIRASAAFEDYLELARLCHKVKGLAGSLHAVQIFAQAAWLEKQAVDQEDAALEQVESLADALEQLGAELVAHTKKP
jgi:HPt (histidine-containing phosphotransfer) domain-containing protein